MRGVRAVTDFFLEAIMRDGPNVLAPEPEFTAYHYLLYDVGCYLRQQPNPEQLFDLGDAIHNIPEFLIRYGVWDDKQFRRLYLEPYDRKWAQTEKDFSLIRSLEYGFKRALNKNGISKRKPWWKFWF